MDTDAKRAAMAAHASQATADSGDRTLAALLRLPGPLYRLVLGREWFVQRGRPVPTARGRRVRSTIGAAPAGSGVDVAHCRGARPRAGPFGGAWPARGAVARPGRGPARVRPAPGDRYPVVRDRRRDRPAVRRRTSRCWPPSGRSALWCYGFVITATVPGMRHAQAMTVNVTSSAVSNLVPFGGALGLATTFAMARSWGFSSGAVALSALVTGIWNVFAKLALPMLGLLALVLGTGRRRRAGWSARRRSAPPSWRVALAVLIGTLWSEKRGPDRRAGSSRRSGRPALRLVGSLAPARLGSGRPALAASRDRPGARRMAQADARPRGLPRDCRRVLLYLILTMLGSTLGPAQVFAGFAFGRLLTTIVVTPAGPGSPRRARPACSSPSAATRPSCTSAVLLFSGIVVFLEIPVGAARLPGVAAPPVLAPSGALTRPPLSRGVSSHVRARNRERLCSVGGGPPLPGWPGAGDTPSSARPGAAFDHQGRSGGPTRSSGA